MVLKLSFITPIDKSAYTPFYPTPVEKTPFNLYLLWSASVACLCQPCSVLGGQVEICAVPKSNVHVKFLFHAILNLFEKILFEINLLQACANVPTKLRY